MLNFVESSREGLFRGQQDAIKSYVYALKGEKSRLRPCCNKGGNSADKTRHKGKSCGEDDVREMGFK